MACFYVSASCFTDVASGPGVACFFADIHKILKVVACQHRDTLVGLPLQEAYIHNLQCQDAFVHTHGW